MNRNRKLLISVLSILLLTFALGYPAQAQAAIPDPQGSINDYAQMLTSSEQQQVAKAIDAAKLNFYVFTTPSLEGQSISTLSETIFEEWSLSTNDVLIVIADQDREVQFEVATGSPIDRGIASLPSNYGGTGASNPFTAFLDRHFIPHAMNGDFKQGIIETVEELSALYVATMEQGNSSNQGAASSPSESGSSVMPLLIILLAVAVFIALGNVLHKHYERKKLTAKKEELTAQHQAALVSIHNLEQELKPILQFSRGKSEAYIKEAKSGFYDLLQNATAFTSEINSFSIPFWFKKQEINSKLSSFSKAIDGFKQSITVIQAALESYKQVEKEVSPLLQSCKAELNKTETLLQEQLNELQYPLDHLTSKKEAIKDTVHTADHSIQFDPLYVKELLEGVPDQLAELRKEIELVRDQTSEFKKLPDKLKLSRQHIDELIEGEKLILTEIDPYSAFNKVNEQQSSLERALQLGEIGTSTSLLEKINEWLDDSLEQVKRSIAARDWLIETVSQVESDVHTFDESCLNKLNKEIEKVQSDYHPVHWEAQLEGIGIMAENRLTIVQQLPEIKHCMAPDIQKYFEGENHLTQMVQLLNENKNIQQDILGLKTTLDEQSERLEKENQQLAQRFNQGLSRIQHHAIGMVQAVQDAEMQIRELARNIERIGNEPTLHVFALEDAVKQMDRLIRSFEEQIESSIQAKKRAEKAIQEFNTSYSSALQRYRGKIKGSYYTSEYNDIVGKIEVAFKQGDYGNISSYIADGEQLITRMKRDYQQQVELERQIALERQRQRQLQRMRHQQTWGGYGRSNSGGSSRGGGGSFGSRSSGGGSGWGRSSGGSSGFSRNSGGKSSWGSGGSRGGRSKW